MDKGDKQLKKSKVKKIIRVKTKTLLTDKKGHTVGFVYFRYEHRGSPYRLPFFWCPTCKRFIKPKSDSKQKGIPTIKVRVE